MNTFTPTQQQLEEAKEDFRLFLWLMWNHLGLPEPTPIQYEMAEYMQHGPKRRILEGFRGVGKSWICSAYVIWRLWRNPNLSILVLSAAKDRSDAFTTFTKRLLSEVPYLSHLVPDSAQGDRDSSLAFDVRGSSAKHAPSVRSYGVYGTITGGRADVVVVDDVEVPNNTETVAQRDKLRRRLSEAGAAMLTSNPE